MKKLLSILAVLVLTLGLFACNPTDDIDDVDPAQEKLDLAYNGLSTLIADPSNIKTGFVVISAWPTSGVTAVWTSSNPAVVSFGTPSNNQQVASVTRPPYEGADATVTITAVLSIKSELDPSVTLTKTWSKALTVKKDDVAPIVIETIADILALADDEYDGGHYQVTLPATVFAKGDAGTAFVYDGTGIIQVYTGMASSMVVGKVYDITGTLEWFYGIWEITNSTVVEKTGATPTLPQKEVIESLGDTLNQLIDDKIYESAHGTAADGNFEPIYATVTARIHSFGTGNYETYLIDTELDPEDFVTGSLNNPSNGLLVYYQTPNFTDLKNLNGLLVTVDVVIYTYRSNNNAFAMFYVGGPNGIQIEDSDEAFVLMDGNSIELPEVIYGAEDITLPTGPLAKGSTVTWVSSHPAIISATGEVNFPEELTRVTLTGTVTFNEASLVITREIAVMYDGYPDKYVFSFGTQAQSGYAAAVLKVINDDINLPFGINKHGVQVATSENYDPHKEAGAFLVVSHSNAGGTAFAEFDFGADVLDYMTFDLSYWSDVDKGRLDPSASLTIQVWDENEEEWVNAAVQVHDGTAFVDTDDNFVSTVVSNAYKQYRVEATNSKYRILSTSEGTGQVRFTFDNIEFGRNAEEA